MGLIYLIDRKDNGHTRCRSMVDRLNRLGHDTIISRYNNNCDIRHLRTTGTHRRKGLMTRCIQESDATTIGQLHVVSTNVLCDTTSLTRNHIRITDIIQQRGLSVINVTHHGDNRWTRYPILLIVILLFIGLNSLYHVCTDILCLEAKLVSYNIDGLRIQTLVDRDHDTNTHAGAYDFCHGHIHHVRQVVRSHKLSQLQHLAFLFLLLQQLVLTLCRSLTFVTAILRALVILVIFAGQAS